MSAGPRSRLIWTGDHASPELAGRTALRCKAGDQPGRFCYSMCLHVSFSNWGINQTQIQTVIVSTSVSVSSNNVSNAHREAGKRRRDQSIAVVLPRWRRENTQLIEESVCGRGYSPGGSGLGWFTVSPAGRDSTHQTDSSRG